MNPRTRLLLEGPIVPTLLKLGAPNVLVLVAQASAGLIETYFVGKLGTDALAGVALVFPVIMLMQMMSAGAIGGGISSAIARALGARRLQDANALVMHAVWASVGFGVIFMAAVLLGGRWLYAHMGGHDGSLEAAMTYSNIVFCGAVVVWVFNALLSVLRGTGNMATPAVITLVGTLVLVPLSPALIFGIGPIPAMGVAGGAVALLIYYTGSAIWAAAAVLSPRCAVKPALRGFTFKRDLLMDILRVGMFGAISTIATNVAIAVATGLVGTFGAAAIAGYGTASRLEYLMVPLVFGFGGPLVAMVGTCMGAGDRERALKATWIGAAMAGALTETIGLAAAIFPHAWLSLFGSDPAMLDAGTRYLRIVGPLYGFFGVGLLLFFASQGAGRLKWPVIGNVARVVVAAGIGSLALSTGGGLSAVFAVQGLALVAYGLICVMAMAGGAWFGPVGWPCWPSTLLQRLRAAPTAA